MHWWMRVGIKTGVLAAIVGFAFSATPAQAQRTGDHIVPSIETVCDGDPFNFGLCNAYCEALDCESPTPLGTPRACSNLLRNYMKKSGGLFPPCSCSCSFDLEADILVLLEEDEDYDVDNPIIDCGPVGPNGESGLSFVALIRDDDQVPENEEGGEIVYFLNTVPEVDTCNELGLLYDPYPGDLTPGILFNRTVPLELGELGACQSVLNFLCDALDPLE